LETPENTQVCLPARSRFCRSRTWSIVAPLRPLQRTLPPMPNRLALILGALIAAAILADQVLNGGAAGLFLMRKFVDMVEYLSFWR
jgi:hypothetical protein